MKVLSLLAAPLLISASPLLAERQADRSVDALLKGVGKLYFGAATEKAKIDTGKTGDIVKGNFGQVTNEYLMKWDQTEPSRNQFTLGPANDLVSWAITNGKSIRGHTLVWGEALPAWVTQITDKATLTAVIQNHVKTVMAGPDGSWKGKIRSWDVVNEVIETDGTMKKTHFFNVLGEDYIGIAFNAAHEADPNAKLYINDYNLEDASFAQFQGLFQKVKEWKAKNIPIHGIGSQTHLKTDLNAAAGLESALRQLATIVDEVAVTELDVWGSNPQVYEQAVIACYHVPTCVGVTTWEVRDETDSTSPADNKALFKNNYDPKDAYYAIADTLAKYQQ